MVGASSGSWAVDHAYQITASIGLVTFALTKKKLTPAGVVSAILVAFVHMLDPYPVFFWLLVPFFLLGVLVTKIGHKAKAHLTKSSTGSTGGEGTRGAMQVFANSGFAAIMIALHTYQYHQARSQPQTLAGAVESATGLLTQRESALQSVLPIGIMAHYAAVAADTFGSELGILAKTEPFLITAPWKRVPRGTNGGVTIDGLVYGLLASCLMTAIAAAGLANAAPHHRLSAAEILLVIVMGVFGSIVDSYLGATVQATVTEKESGKVVEGPGGQRVKVMPGGSRAMSGRDLLTNNGVNMAMAVIASVSAMGVAYAAGLNI
ncbi:hypothetical protein AMS68_005181 [Peltaster fructicola]|uniref:DUF92 domain-containing protein n=1 Tax=Peltaster fructicola TaxID=286661 RepID=A0A6H0XY54_9PEZI|nr:hypothetical protein AMS68_005181 [Peltaster fructicola]